MFFVNKIALILVLYQVVQIVYLMYSHPVSVECGNICGLAFLEGSLKLAALHNLTIFNVPIHIPINVPLIQSVLVLVFIIYQGFYSPSSKMINSQSDIFVKIFLALVPL